MSRDYLPATDNGLLAFANPFSSQITATPTAFGCSSNQATVLSTALSSYSTKLAAAQDPNSRGPAAVLQKDLAKQGLVTEIRALARQIQGTQSVTDDQRQQLGLNIRATRTPINPPTECPMVDIISVVGRTVKCKVHKETGDKRGKPPGVASVFVYSYVGTSVPADPSLYKFEGSSTKPTFDVVFPNSVAGGAQVFITAMWANPRNECGPGCEPVTTYLQGASAAAA